MNLLYFNDSLNSFYQQNYQRMQRQKKQSLQSNRQKTPYCVRIQSTHFFNHQRKKYKPSHLNIHSLHSIDTKRSSVNLHKVKLHHRRRQLSIPINNSKHSLSERPETIDTTSKKNIESNDVLLKKYSERRIAPLYIRHKYERVNTLQDERCEEREKKAKNCIQIMCGVLQEVKHQRDHKKESKSKIIDQFSDVKHKEGEEKTLSKFESYVRSITKLKQSNKAIIIKRGKSKSIINNENIPSSNLSNVKSFIIKQSEKQTPFLAVQPLHRRSNTSIVESTKQQCKELGQISCSSIGKANQSSFVSEFSNKSFMRNLFENQAKVQQRQPKKMSKIKNSKQIKNMFPIGFF